MEQVTIGRTQIFSPTHILPVEHLSQKTGNESLAQEGTLRKTRRRFLVLGAARAFIFFSLFSCLLFCLCLVYSCLSFLIILSLSFYIAERNIYTYFMQENVIKNKTKETVGRILPSFPPHTRKKTNTTLKKRETPSQSSFQNGKKISENRVGEKFVCGNCVSAAPRKNNWQQRTQDASKQWRQMALAKKGEKKK